MRVHAHGKINLYLDVLDRRPDGYTNIETIFQTVSLHDTLTFDKRDHELVLTCSDASLEVDASNLVLRAATILQARTSCDKGVCVHLEKRIPVAGGMAGGSVDAAATLHALNKLWDLGLDDAALHNCALELGSDVPYCLTGGTMAATGRGEHLQRIEPLPKTWFVVVQPALGISAGDVYKHPALTRNTEDVASGRTSSFESALNKLRSGRVSDVLFNRMESAIFVMHPGLAELKEAMTHEGCVAAIVSGSGPTLMGLCESETDALRISKSFSDLDVSVTRTTDCSIVIG